MCVDLMCLSDAQNTTFLALILQKKRALLGARMPTCCEPAPILHSSQNVIRWWLDLATRLSVTRYLKKLFSCSFRRCKMQQNQDFFPRLMFLVPSFGLENVSISLILSKLSFSWFFFNHVWFFENKVKTLKFIVKPIFN